jgi:probable phosphoglycerate mutase
MIILLLRHAESEDNNLNVLGGNSEANITEYGKTQAIKIGKELSSKYLITEVYCSPRKRCLMTSELVLKEPNKDIPVNVTNKLSERDFGLFSGKLMSEVDFSLIDKQEKGNEYKVESIEEVKERVESFIQDLKSKHKETDTILVITHSNPIRIFSMIVEDISFEEVLKKKNIKNAEYILYEI